MFGEIFKKERKKLGLTQEQIAKKLEISRSNVANWENNSNIASPEMILKSANLFKCSTDYLLGKSKYRNEMEHILDYIKTNEFKNYNKIFENINKGLMNSLKLNEFYSFTEEQLKNNIDLPKDRSEIFFDKLKELNLLKNDKELNDNELNVIFNFIENNKEMLKTLIDKEENNEYTKEEYKEIMKEIQDK